MKDITLTVNGRQVTGKEGSTVLEICRANDIDVPTLCHLDGLSDVGACRMCVVEIEGERKPVPSCTYPARDGLVVRTDTEQLEKYRRQILELLFAERNHFCMFCEQSGNCELQKLAYRYQMDNVRYPYQYPSYSLDALSDYLVVEHNRCVLCGRCVRVCSEVAATQALDFGGRGVNTVVSADLSQPVSESSCTSCGACVQACPTGAIFSKLSLYKGIPDECQRMPTVCPGCAVGCPLDVLVKDGNIVSIEAPELTGLKGPLCKEGRFELLRNTHPRITAPLLRGEGGELAECEWEKAAEVIAGKAGELKDGFGGLISARMPSETLSMFDTFVREALGSDLLDTLDGEIYRTISEGIGRFQKNGQGLDIECPVEEIVDADCILIVGADPRKTNPIIGNLVQRAIRQNEAKLIVIDPSRNVFPLVTDLWLKPEAGSEGTLLSGLGKALIDRGLLVVDKAGTEVTQSLKQVDLAEVSRTTGVDAGRLGLAAEMYGQAERAVIIYGEGLLANNDPSFVTSLLNLALLTGNSVGKGLRVLSLKPGANSRGAWDLGLAAQAIDRDRLKGLYLVLGDDLESNGLAERLEGIGFLVVQASYRSPVTDKADVVLPSPIWAEREGKYVSIDGTSLEFKQVLQPAEDVLEDREILSMLSRKLGHELTTS